MKIHAATADNKVLLSVTVSRPGVPGGVLLFGTNFVDGKTMEKPSRETDAALAVGIDSISSALCLLHEESQQRTDISLRGNEPVAGAVGTGGDISARRRLSVGSASGAAVNSPGARASSLSFLHPDAGGGAAAAGDTPASAAAAGQENEGNEAGDDGSEGDVSDQEAWVSALLEQGTKKNRHPEDGSVADSLQSRQSPRGVPRSSGAEAGGSILKGDGVEPGAMPVVVGLAVPGKSSTGGGEAVPSTNGAVAAASEAGGSATVGSRLEGGASVNASATGGMARATPSTASQATGHPRDYTLSHNFQLPGLTVAPPRIVTPFGRGRSRDSVPEPATTSVRIPDSVVLETEAELRIRHRDKSFRNRLLEFVGLYKFVVDTLVKRRTTELAARVKVDHNYYQLTPEAARGTTVRFRIRGGEVSFSSPVFKNTRYMINDEYLAIIMLMKVRGDAFFLWLLAMFSGGALAPPVSRRKAAVDGAIAGPSTPAAVKKNGRKRQRGSPQQIAAAKAAAVGGRSDGSRGGSVSRSSAGENRSAGQDRGSRADGIPDEQAPGGVGGGSGGAGVPSRGGESISAAHALESRAGARKLLLDGRAVATAQLLVDMTMLHGADTPPTVVTAFIIEIEAGCEDAVYPYGQDPLLCLEKGNPSPTPVALRSIATGYRVAWPVSSIG